VDLAGAVPPAAAAGTTPADMIASFARLHGLLAYLRLASRFGAMWGPHPDLERSDGR
jgi:hypothetical protein